MDTIALRLDRDTRHKLELLAEAMDCPRSTLVHEAVRRFVDAEFAALLARQKETQTEGASSSFRPHPDHWKIIV
jgi:predicted transcriptional regulator